MGKIDGGKRQRLVDRVFRRCLGRDQREREDMVDEVLREVGNLLGEEDQKWIVGWSRDLRDQEIRVMLSRVASREDEVGEWEFFPTYTKEKKYLSVERVRYLSALVRRGMARDDEIRKLKEMKADLEVIYGHWEEQERRARKRKNEVGSLRMGLPSSLTKEGVE